MGANRDSVEVVGINEERGGLLDATYYSKVDRCENIDIVIKLEASRDVQPSVIPQRYVILMDVSASMDAIDKEDNISLLEHIKIFGHLFVDKLTEESSVSIVTFNNKGEIVLPMTQLDDAGKKIAHRSIKNMTAGGGSNISDGLLTALKAIKSNQPTRDCIILFTDGQPNVGITDANVLVREFRDRVKNTRRANEVSVSAITIGNNQPFFMNQVAASLGSESFYCLNVDCDFEADMLLPMLLREAPSLVDVKLEMSCQHGVTFNEDKVKHPSLKEARGKDGRKYFIHILPRTLQKNIIFSLKIPKKGYELHGKRILEVSKSFLDNNLTEHRSTDFLELRLTSMKEVMYEAHAAYERPTTYMNVGPDALDYLENTSSYITRNNKTNPSWEEAQESMAKVLGQQCRVETIAAISSSAELVDHGQAREATRTFNQALKEINKIEEVIVKVLGKDNLHCKALQENVKEDYKEKLQFLSTELIYRNMNPGRLTAMASSFSTEMPTASGVFEEKKKQPFMPHYVDSQHDSYKQIVREITASEITSGGEDLNRGTDKLKLPLILELEEEAAGLDLPEIPDHAEVSKRTVYLGKISTPLSGPEDYHYDADSLFLTSLLPDIQQLDPQQKFELKMEILRLIHKALYSDSQQN